MGKSDDDSKSYTVYGDVAYWCSVRAHSRFEAAARALREGEWEPCNRDYPIPTLDTIREARCCDDYSGDIPPLELKVDRCRAMAELVASAVLEQFERDAKRFEFDLFEGLTELIARLECSRGKLLLDQGRSES